METDTWLKIVSGMVASAVLFGIGAITVLAVPALAANAKYLIPVVVVTSIVGSLPIAVWIARRMRYRNWGRQDWNKGDWISG
jgi:hypothetical protein